MRGPVLRTAVRWVALLAVGLVVGWPVGTVFLEEMPEWENETTDLVPPVGEVSLVQWLVLLSLPMVAGLAVSVSKARPVVLGWSVGVLAPYLVTLVYTWRTFGHFGLAPTP